MTTMDRQTRILAWIHIVLGGGGMLIAGSILGVWLWITQDIAHIAVLRVIVQIFVTVSVIVLAPCLIGGIGLLQGKLWGRVVIIAYSMLLLIVIPVGTLLGGYGLWVLLRQTPVTAGSQGRITPVV